MANRDNLWTAVSQPTYEHVEKYKNQETRINVNRFVLASNHDIVVKTGRRICILRASSKYKDDKKYFNDLKAFFEQESNAKAVYEFLKNRDISHQDFSEKRIPKTDDYFVADAVFAEPQHLFLKFLFSQSQFCSEKDEILKKKFAEIDQNPEIDIEIEILPDEIDEEIKKKTISGTELAEQIRNFNALFGRNWQGLYMNTVLPNRLKNMESETKGAVRFYLHPRKRTVMYDLDFEKMEAFLAGKGMTVDKYELDMWVADAHIGRP